jgi:hypothetical protein
MSKLDPVPDAVLDCDQARRQAAHARQDRPTSSTYSSAPSCIEVIDDLQALRAEHATLVADSAWKAATRAEGDAVKEVSKAGSALDCEGVGCRSRFATASDGSVVRSQAAAAGSPPQAMAPSSAAKLPQPVGSMSAASRSATRRATRCPPRRSTSARTASRRCAAMARSSTKSSAAVTCDYPGCAGTFVTFSFAALARAQAKARGWTRRRGRVIADPDEPDCYIARGAVDICPDHGELPKPARETRDRKTAPQQQEASP